MLESAKNQMRTKISKSSYGKIFFSDDFVKYASADNVRQVLSRLENEHLIERLAQGIYIKPKIDPVLGIIYPSTEEVAKEIAKRDKAHIAPTGVMALYLLGLTTQVPLKAVYLTDGSQREIKIEKRTIKFKRTVPKSFAIKDELLFLTVQAFKEIGQKEITPKFLQIIQHSIQKIDPKVLADQLRYAPVWIQKEIRKYVD